MPLKIVYVGFTVRGSFLLGTLLQSSSNYVPLQLCLHVSVQCVRIILCDWSPKVLALHRELHHLCYVLKAFWSAEYDLIVLVYMSCLLCSKGASIPSICQKESTGWAAENCRRLCNNILHEDIILLYVYSSRVFFRLCWGKSRHDGSLQLGLAHLIQVVFRCLPVDLSWLR